MSKMTKMPPALKHGGYAAMGLLPGEDRAAFDKLRHDLIARWSPTDPLEEDTVEEMARLLWRKRNLGTIRNAEFARNRYAAIKSANLPASSFSIPMLGMLDISPAKMEEALQAAEEQAREELGDMYRLVEIGDTATFGCLEKELAIEERLGELMYKCVKRMLLLRGLNSISTASPSTPQRRIPGPPNAA
jgi:hypothetical protein